MEMPTSALTGVTLKDMFDAGLHFGHQTKRWNPKMKGYIFDKRNGIHIIDLAQTVGLLDDAAAFPLGYYNSSMISDNDKIGGAAINTADYYWVTTDIYPAA